MKKRWKFIVCMCFVLVLAITVFSPKLVSESTCQKNGWVCTGECCKVTADGCVAGPCSIIFPAQ